MLLPLDSAFDVGEDDTYRYGDWPAINPLLHGLDDV
jgi:hypothetical protein